MSQPLKEIEESCRAILKKVKMKPRVGIILGTGLGNLVNRAAITESLSYDEIPHFPSSTVEGHAGRLLFGRLAGKNVLIMQGRVHYYEGYSLFRITLPVRVMKRLGIQILIISNAAGGLNPLFQPGNVMAISDHIKLYGTEPFDRSESRFPRSPVPGYDHRL